MEIDRITIFIKPNKGGKMACKKNMKILKEGKKVVPNLKRVVRTAIKDTKRSYPY